MRSTLFAGFVAIAAAAPHPTPEGPFIPFGNANADASVDGNANGNANADLLPIGGGGGIIPPVGGNGGIIPPVGGNGGIIPPVGGNGGIIPPVGGGGGIIPPIGGGGGIIPPIGGGGGSGSGTIIGGGGLISCGVTVSVQCPSGTSCVAEVCVSNNPCGGLLATSCPSGSTCVNPRKNCDPLLGAVDCQGVCAPKKTGGSPGQPPKGGPKPKPKPAKAGQTCGTKRGIQCQKGLVCVDKRDNCDPKRGGKNCPGTCMKPLRGLNQSCSTKDKCAKGLVCADKKDNCKPRKGKHCPTTCQRKK